MTEAIKKAFDIIEERLHDYHADYHLEAEIGLIKEYIETQRELLERILDHAEAGYAEHQARRSAWQADPSIPADLLTGADYPKETT